MESTSIHLAIPSYNNESGVKRVLERATKQTFASITVLDDGSTDKTFKIVADFPGVKYIRTEENSGSVAAKNLILRDLPEDGWLLYIDSDMEIVSDNIPEKLSDFVARHPKVGAGVGLIRRDGEPMRFLRGYDLNPVRMILAAVFYTLHQALPKNSSIQLFVRKLAHPFTMDFHPIEESMIDWAVEGFSFYKIDLFRQYNGFDSAFIRNHEGPDLCLKLRKAGHQVWFFPGIELRDNDQHCHSNWWRRYQWWRSTLIYFVKHPSRLFVWGRPLP